MPASVARGAFSVALGGILATSALAEKPSDATPTPPAATPAASESPAPDQEFNIPVQKGVPVKGIKVPHFNAEGKQIMMFEAEVARKIDDDHLEMDNLTIEAVSDDGKKFYIALPSSVFNLQTRILTGDKHVSIRREDFEITGDAGEFHTKTRFAKIFGNVKMIIFNTDKLDQR